MELQQRRTIVTGALLLSNIMAGMDGTIVNTALPAITSDLHGLQYMGWIIATFLLGMAVANHYGGSFFDGANLMDEIRELRSINLNDLYDVAKRFIVSRGISVFQIIPQHR